MTETKKSIADALDEVLKEAPPKVRKNAVYDELRQHEKMIKAALKAGWSASQLAAKLRDVGVHGSVDRMRTEILKISGVERSKRPKRAQADKIAAS